MPQERTWRRILTEAGAVVQKNQKLADMKIEVVSPMDDRMVEIMATGLPLYQGMPLVCDASLVSPIKLNGIARPRAAHEPGIAIANVEDAQAMTDSELISSTQCKFVALTGAVGGRWILSHVASSKPSQPQRVTTQRPAFARQ